MPACAVAICRYRRNSSKDSKTLLHRFPRNPSLRKQWILKCFRKDQFNPKNARICSQHFLPTDYFLVGNSTKLKSNAIPSINISNSKPNASVNSENKTK